MSITHESLLGEHWLSGVFCDLLEESHEGGESKQVMRFTLDWIHYAAIEDPQDDYRNSLGEFEISSVPPKTSFDPVLVIGRLKDQYILQYVHPQTEKVILELGTSDAEDYYPGYVAEFHPENIPPQSEKIVELEPPSKLRRAFRRLLEF